LDKNPPVHGALIMLEGDREGGLNPHQLVATNGIEADVSSLHQVKKQVKVEEKEEKVESFEGGRWSKPPHYHQPAANHSHR